MHEKISLNWCFLSTWTCIYCNFNRDLFNPGVIRFKTIDLKHGDIFVQIKGEKSGRYLAINKSGRLYTTVSESCQYDLYATCINATKIFTTCANLYVVLMKLFSSLTILLHRSVRKILIQTSYTSSTNRLATPTGLVTITSWPSEGVGVRIDARDSSNRTNTPISSSSKPTRAWSALSRNQMFLWRLRRHQSENVRGAVKSWLVRRGRVVRGGGSDAGKRGKKDEDGERVKKQTQDHRVPEDRF